nr:MAG TPA: hypothetical protein [Caudoviricetes sp.]
MFCSFFLNRNVCSAAYIECRKKAEPAWQVFRHA